MHKGTLNKIRKIVALRNQVHAKNQQRKVKNQNQKQNKNLI